MGLSLSRDAFLSFLTAFFKGFLSFVRHFSGTPILFKGRFKGCLSCLRPFLGISILCKAVFKGFLSFFVNAFLRGS